MVLLRNTDDSLTSYKQSDAVCQRLKRLTTWPFAMKQLVRRPLMTPEQGIVMRSIFKEVLTTIEPWLTREGMYVITNAGRVDVMEQSSGRQFGKKQHWKHARNAMERSARVISLNIKFLQMNRESALVGQGGTSQISVLKGLSTRDIAFEHNQTSAIIKLGWHIIVGSKYHVVLGVGEQRKHRNSHLQ